MPPKYIFSDDQAAVDDVLVHPISGAGAVDVCAIQGGLPSLAFGGVGMSGMGCHHGIERFREFSNQRGIVVRGKDDHIDSFHAPYSKASAMAEVAFAG